MIERQGLGDLTAVPTVHAASSADRLLVATAHSASAAPVTGDRNILECGAGGTSECWRGERWQRIRVLRPARDKAGASRNNVDSSENS